VGAGRVGSTFAYALLLSGLVSEIVLVNAERVEAEGDGPEPRATLLVRDSYLSRRLRRLRTGRRDGHRGGAAQKSGETRLELARKNARVFGQIVPAVSRPDTDGCCSSPQIRWTC
jgi:L-lactate dehydrogenase